MDVLRQKGRCVKNKCAVAVSKMANILLRVELFFRKRKVSNGVKF